MADYEFRYAPLTGRLTGKQMIEQTEQAINQLSSLVDSAAGQVEIISTLANEANENAATALETAEEALATTGRTYITVSTQTDANNYYDSQLIYIADSTSTNIPVADTGMLEVKTNDNKTACEQVFIAASSGDAYYRNGAITAETVGDVTTYTVTWGGWSSQPASQAYVQGELANYLPLSGGTVSGNLTVTGDIAGGLVGNVTGLASGNLPLSGGTMVGAILGNPLTLTADDGNDSADLVLNPSGSATWNGKEVERVNASGTNYIRFESGLQICWADLGGVEYNTQKNWDFPVPFKDTNYFVCASCRQLGFGSAMTISAQAGTTSQAWIKQWNTASAGSLLIAFAIGWWK